MQARGQSQVLGVAGSKGCARGARPSPPTLPFNVLFAALPKVCSYSDLVNTRTYIPADLVRLNKP